MKVYTLDEMRNLILARKAIEEPLLDTSPASDAWLDANAVAHLALLIQAQLKSAYDDLWVASASSEALDRHAAQWLRVPRLAAVAWEGTVQLTAFVKPPPDVPVGTVLRATDGTVYKTTEAVGTGGIAWGEKPGTSSASVAYPKATAVEAGASGTKPTGTALTVQSPPVGLDSNASIYTTTTAGTDAEDDDHLRQRLHMVLSYRPGAGSCADYVSWAMEASTQVARAWVYPRWGTNSNEVLVIVSPEDPRTNLDAATRTTIQNYIDSVRPVGANVTVSNPEHSTATVTADVRCRSGYGPDWEPPGGTSPQVRAGSTKTRIYYDLAGWLPEVGSRVVIETSVTIESRVYYRHYQRIVVAAHSESGGGWFDLNEALPYDPITGTAIRPGGPVWQACYNAMLAHFDNLGPSVSTVTTQPRFPTPSADGHVAGLYGTDFLRILDSIDGVQHATLDGWTDITNTVAPPDTPRLYHAQAVILRLHGPTE